EAALATALATAETARWELEGQDGMAAWPSGLTGGWSVLQGWASSRESKKLAVLLRDIFGNPFRPLPLLPASLLHWDGGGLVQLPRAADEERPPPEGLRDPARLAVLADALEEAGCTDTEILGHLRGEGPHVRGCFSVDAVLGKA